MRKTRSDSASPASKRSVSSERKILIDEGDAGGKKSFLKTATGKGLAKGIIHEEQEGGTGGQNAVAVDLTSTLSQFGYGGFEVGNYVSQYFTHNPVDTAEAHCDELQERKAIVSRALKNYVTEHYSQFIHTSEQTQRNCFFL
jgi:hypothetical protein